ncbi:MAG: hypothetical protein RBS78_01090 [Coriobacteriia bacterium]|jgi:hypothetical protein|nr:hypothetical protein [Coriobacteriia bacterium]
MSDARERGDDARLQELFADPPAPIPKFNWGAFLIPPIWGVANGQWPGVFFLPLWLFIDNVLRGPRVFGVWSTVGGVVLAGITIAAQTIFAANANRLAWHRFVGRLTPEQYARRQRAWGIGGIVTIAVMAVWITFFVLGYGN